MSELDRRLPLAPSAGSGQPRPSHTPPPSSPRPCPTESQPLLGAHGGRHGNFYSPRGEDTRGARASDPGEECPEPGACPSGCDRESIYRFAIVYPELHRIRNGSYYSCDVFVAVLLLFMTAAMQAYIVQVAGSYILQQSLQQFRSGVLTSRNESEAWLQWETLPPFLRWIERIDTRLAGDQGGECCHDVSCSAKFACCVGGLEAASHQTRRAVIKPQRLDAMCHKDQDGLDCGPSSFQLIGRWHELDANGDGLWSHDEAVADAANLGCRLQLSQVELLRTVCLGIAEDSVVRRELELTTKRAKVPYEVESMLAVPRDYFELWEGIAVICAVVDPARCGDLVHDGVFDGALGPSATGDWSLASAVEYCGKLLAPGGLCDKTLPVTYALHRQSFRSQCGAGVYSAGPLTTSPHNQRDSLRAVSVRYVKVSDYELVHSLTFRFFMGIMLVLWFATVSKELESVFTMAYFVVHYPSNGNNPLRIPRSKLSWMVLKGTVADTIRDWRDGNFSDSPVSGQGGGCGKHVMITDISHAHRITCWCVLILRTVNLVYMLVVGIVYATCTHSYVDLLMNTVALAFVFELPELFYHWLVPEHVKEVLNNVDLAPLDKVEGENSKLMRLASALGKSRFFQGLVLIPIIAVAIVQVNDTWQTLPMLEVLQCACAQTGPRCEVGKHLTREWWNAHWNATARILDEAPA